MSQQTLESKLDPVPYGQSLREYFKLPETYGSGILLLGSVDSENEEIVAYVGRYGIGNIWMVRERDVNVFPIYREEGIVVVDLMVTIETLKEFIGGLPSPLREPSFGCLLDYDNSFFVAFPSERLRKFTLGAKRRKVLESRREFMFSEIMAGRGVQNQATTWCIIM